MLDLVMINFASQSSGIIHSKWQTPANNLFRVGARASRAAVDRKKVSLELGIGIEVWSRDAPKRAAQPSCYNQGRAATTLSRGRPPDAARGECAVCERHAHGARP